MNRRPKAYESSALPLSYSGISNHYQALTKFPFIAFYRGFLHADGVQTQHLENMKKPTWERTPVQNLLRNESSGRYYARWTISGKQKWVSLDTDVLSVAKLRLADEAKRIEGLRRSATAVTDGTGCMADLMRLYEERTLAHTELRPSSIASRLIALKKLRKTWPELENMKPAQVTPAAVQDWATRFKTTGTNFRPPGAKTVVKGNSATSVNRAIDTLRRILDIAIERGAIFSNPVSVQPADGKLKKKITRKKIVLPTRDQIRRLFAEIENNGAVGGWGAEAADFCRFLAYSGCRVGEVPTVTWSCVDLRAGVLHVKGEKTETSNRRVPINDDLKALLTRIRERRIKAAVHSEDGKPLLAPTDSVFRISEAQKSIDRACTALGIERVTHHDLRHLFATTCIECGVDIPTVSRWLGHSDGGALAMKTYGHLRQEHSQSEARKVTFGLV